MLGIPPTRSFVGCGIIDEAPPLDTPCEGCRQVGGQAPAYCRGLEVEADSKDDQPEEGSTLPPQKGEAMNVWVWGVIVLMSMSAIARVVLICIDDYPRIVEVSAKGDMISLIIQSIVVASGVVLCAKTVWG